MEDVLAGSGGLGEVGESKSSGAPGTAAFLTLSFLSSVLRRLCQAGSSLIL